MPQKDDMEAQLLGKDFADAYENEISKNLEKEINDAKLTKKENKIIITDINKLSAEEKFDKNSIYKIFNRKQKTETFVNGEQAENMIKYTDNYIVKFDHRIVFE